MVDYIFGMSRLVLIQRRVQVPVFLSSRLDFLDESTNFTISRLIEMQVD